MIAVAATGAHAGDKNKDQPTAYSYDEDGVPYFGDKVPAHAAEKRKRIYNDQGVVVGELEGRKSDEELAIEALRQAQEDARQLQLREDRALLATYLSVDEIVMHRDRRVELFQAQARVTEMYLKNLERRLTKLTSEADRFQPYSEDPEAPMVDPDLVDEIDFTKETIERHEANLQKYEEDEKTIIQRFDTQIKRFEYLKGMTANAG